jgi:hypothetical protein
MGKYDKLKGKLPTFQQDSTFQQKVDEAKNAYQSRDMTSLVTMCSSVRQKKENLNDQIASLNVELEAISQLLGQHFEDAGLSKLTLEDGTTCYTQTEPYSSVSNQSILLAFIKKQKMSNLLSLAWGTMNAMNKERLVSGKPPLPGTQCFLKTFVRLREGAAQTEEE